MFSDTQIGEVLLHGNETAVDLGKIQLLPFIDEGLLDIPMSGESFVTFRPESGELVREHYSFHKYVTCNLIEKKKIKD